MIYRTQSCKRIIAKTVRQLNLTGEEIPWEDMIEYISDALRHIGAYFQYEQKVCTIPILEYRGKLPRDFESLLRITGVSHSLPTYAEAFSKMDAENIAAYTVKIQTLETYLLTETDVNKIQLYTQEIDNLKVDLKGFIRTRVPLTPKGYSYSPQLRPNSALIDPKTAFTDKDYRIGFDTITTAFAEGCINLIYQATPVDEEGFPLVPDNVMFEEALFWRIASMLAMQDKLKNKELSFKFCDAQWKRYRLGAYADAMMPDLNQMERLKNQFYQLKPRLHLYDSLFSTLGDSQNLNRSGNEF